LQNGSILVTTQKWPAFLYSGNIPGKDYNPEKSDEGFLHGYFNQVLKHIFTSPSSALPGSKVRNTCASNAKIHHMTLIEAYHITYATAHACFSTCLQDKFIEFDGQFSFSEFYYRIIDFIINNEDEAWVEELFSHYNKYVRGSCGVHTDTKV
ncbi:hypothetical protein M404DRAFT_168518, partial [Pisolithus tinctorius Marx 270]